MSESESIDVFLGGACNPTTWRRDLAIPRLTKKDITFYNPQQDHWHEGLIQKEKEAKQNSKILLFVFDPTKTRGLASLIEVAFLAAQQRDLIVVLPRFRQNTFHKMNAFQESEKPKIKQVFNSLVYKILQPNNGHVFRTLDKALEYSEKKLKDATKYADYPAYSAEFTKTNINKKKTAYVPLSSFEKNQDFEKYFKGCVDFYKDHEDLVNKLNEDLMRANRSDSVVLVPLPPYYDIKAQVEVSYVLGMGVQTILFTDESQQSASSPKSPDSGICERVFTDTLSISEEGKLNLPPAGVIDYERARAYLLATAHELSHVRIADSTDHALQIFDELLRSHTTKETV